MIVDRVRKAMARMGFGGFGGGSPGAAGAPPQGPGLPPTQIRSHRSELLDCIRAVAITMVVVYHTSIAHGTAFADMDPIQQFFRLRGMHGVDIFFPLSGYLITVFLMTSTRPDFIRVFFLRRVFRIVPLYMVAVTIAAAGILATGVDRHLLDRIWVAYTFLTAWVVHFEGRNVVPYEITWSLSVEEFAYILFGLMAWWRRSWLPAFFLFTTALAIAIKLDLASRGEGFYFLPLARLDSIAIGGLTAWLFVRGKYPLLVLGGAFVASQVVSALSPVASIALTYTDVSLAVGFLIVVFERWGRNLRTAVTGNVAAIGFYSYFTYLFHVFVIGGLYVVIERSGYVPPPFWIMAVVVLAVTHAAAVVSYRVFEGPMMRFGRRFETPAKASRFPAPEARDRT